MTNVIQNPGAQVAGILADLAGTTPSTGTARYYVGDNLGSTRGVYGADKSTLGTYEYYPYGNMYAQTGAATESLAGSFTGKPYEGSTIDLYYFPYRYYSPTTARWLTRDPLGMRDGLNVYEYTRAMPITLKDADGRLIYIPLLLLMGLAALLGIALSALVCAWNMGMQALNDAPHGGSLQDHCRVACEISHKCHLGTGYLAAVAVEIIEHPTDPSQWNEEEIGAGLIGAGLPGGADCECECKSQFPIKK